MEDNKEITGKIALEYGDRRIASPEMRRLSELYDVVYDPAWFAKSTDSILYYMYRDICLDPSHKEKILLSRMNFTITRIPPYMFGDEYVKTHGHYHGNVIRSNFTYPEIFEVLKGEAIFFMQKVEDGKLTDTCFVKAKEGDKIIIPPKYGHITINPTQKEITVGNWMYKYSSMYYEPMKRTKGGAYFFLKDTIKENKSYPSLPSLRELQPMNFEDLGLAKKSDLYRLILTPEKLDMLKNPQAYCEVWERAVGKKI